MFSKLKDYAVKFNVPIIRDEGLSFLFEQIKKHNVKSCLEIGTAIGYSALNMASLGVSVTTIERNKEMYEEALKNSKEYSFSSLIEFVFMDALEYVPIKTYDMIFIDAAKAQNMKFFNRFTPYLNDGGIVVIDNLDFHGLCDDVEHIESKNLRSMVKKINAFKEWLKDNKDFDTLFTHMGDGMSVSKRK